MTESVLQFEIFTYHWNTFPDERGQLFHINNKSSNRIEGNRMKALGVIPGVSDMVFFAQNGKVYFIELKTEKGRQSAPQIAFQALCERLGHTYVIIRSLDEFKTFHNNLCS